jgi:hypothetical protein
MALVIEAPRAATSGRDILSPLGRRGHRTHYALAPRVATLSGLTIGLLDNSKHGADILLDEVGAILLREHGVSNLVRRRKSTAAISGGPILEELIRNCDAVINAYGDCGSCTSWCVHDSVDLERGGLPVATVNTAEFISLGRLEAQALGMPGLPIVAVPHPIGSLPEADVRARAQAAIAALVAALTTEAAILEAQFMAKSVTENDILDAGIACPI